MTIEEAKNGIGRQFKATGFYCFGKHDTIITVHPNGDIEGNFIIAHHSICSFKQQQPEQLKKNTSCQNFSH